MKNERIVPCRICKHVREDRTMNEDGWIAYECGNPESEFFKALLNVTEKGAKQQRITWVGCPHGEVSYE